MNHRGVSAVTTLLTNNHQVHYIFVEAISIDLTPVHHVPTTSCTCADVTIRQQFQSGNVHARKSHCITVMIVSSQVMFFGIKNDKKANYHNTTKHPKPCLKML